MVHRSKALPYLEVLFAVVVWGASFIATKVALREVEPVTVVWLRFAMGVAILGAAVWIRKEFVLPKRDELYYFAFLGFLGITFHQWLQSNGLVTAEAGTTAWIVATTPVFMLILGRIFLREYISWIRASGILIAGIGVLLVMSKGDFQSLAIGGFGGKGNLLILISAPNWAVFSTLSRRGLRRHPAARMMFFVMVLGWLFTSVLLFAGPGLAEIGRISRSGWLSLGFLGILASGLAYIAWYDALQSLPAAQVGAFLNLEPLVAVGVALAVLGETVTPASMAGGALILLGVYRANLPSKPRLNTM